MTNILVLNDEDRNHLRDVHAEQWEINRDSLIDFTKNPETHPLTDEEFDSFVYFMGLHHRCYEQLIYQGAPRLLEHPINQYNPNRPDNTDNGEE